jgi:hypothetical protein
MLNNNSLELKIKAKHLGEEAKIIRFEEEKLKKQMKWARNTQQNEDTQNFLWLKYFSLSSHRKFDVGSEVRATQLARAFLKNLPYQYVEQSRSSLKEASFKNIVVPRIVSMVLKYGYGVIKTSYNYEEKKKEIQKAIDKWTEL